jgi:CheY-like chemotaxis protein
LPNAFEAVLLLEGLKVLVVEDETIISMLLEDMLQELGCSGIWHASNVGSAFAILDGHEPDLALLDVNLGGELAYPIATRLGDAGIPFVFTTGYGRAGIPEIWSPTPVIQKPFALSALAKALQSVLEQRRSSTPAE